MKINVFNVCADGDVGFSSGCFKEYYTKLKHYGNVRYILVFQIHYRACPQNFDYNYKSYASLRQKHVFLKIIFVFQ
jgi:hypothetical protein